MSQEIAWTCECCEHEWWAPPEPPQTQCPNCEGCDKPPAPVDPPKLKPTGP